MTEPFISSHEHINIKRQLTETSALVRARSADQMRKMYTRQGKINLSVIPAFGSSYKSALAVEQGAMKEGSWTLRFQKSDIKRTSGLPQMGQKFLWDVTYMQCCLPTLGEREREASAHVFSHFFFFFFKMAAIL